MWSWLGWVGDAIFSVWWKALKAYLGRTDSPQAATSFCSEKSFMDATGPEAGRVVMWDSPPSVSLPWTHLNTRWCHLDAISRPDLFFLYLRVHSHSYAAPTVLALLIPEESHRSFLLWDQSSQRTPASVSWNFRAWEVNWFRLDFNLENHICLPLGPWSRRKILFCFLNFFKLN